MKPLFDQDALERLLIKILCTRWLWLVAVWLPFPCFFLPFGFVLDDHDPWYLEHTRTPFLLATLFYTPAHLAEVGVASLVGGDPSPAWGYVPAFTQSALLMWLVMKFKRRWVEDRPKPGHAAGP